MKTPESNTPRSNKPRFTKKAARLLRTGKACLNIYGNGMSPRVMNGDTVMCDARRVVRGKLVAVSFMDGRAFVGYYYSRGRKEFELKFEKGPSLRRLRSEVLFMFRVSSVHRIIRDYTPEEQADLERDWKRILAERAAKPKKGRAR